MKKLSCMALPLVAVAMMSSVSSMTLAQSSPAGNGTQSSAEQDWNAPPAGTPQTQQGYRDGILAARLDTLAKRKVDAKSSHLYLHPPVKGDAQTPYRTSFEAGYQAALQHGATS
jgi:hypothetical protein